MALSTTEAEYIELSVRSSVASQASDRFTRSQDGFYDYNQSCVKLFENLVFHDRMQHVEIKFNFSET
jgi:hypothetical protein